MGKMVPRARSPLLLGRHLEIRLGRPDEGGKPRGGTAQFADNVGIPTFIKDDIDLKLDSFFAAYTSLLRISTAVPEHTSATVPTLATPAPAVVKTGPISGRPGFLRGLSSSQKPVAPSTGGVEHPLDGGVQTNISSA